MNGYLINNQDSKELIEKVEAFLALSHEEKRKMGLNGRKKVEREFDRNIVVKKYIESIRNLVG